MAKTKSKGGDDVMREVRRVQRLLDNLRVNLSEYRRTSIDFANVSDSKSKQSDRIHKLVGSNDLASIYGTVEIKGPFRNETLAVIAESSTFYINRNQRAVCMNEKELELYFQSKRLDMGHIHSVDLAMLSEGARKGDPFAINILGDLVKKKIVNIVDRNSITIPGLRKGLSLDNE